MLFFSISFHLAAARPLQVTSSSDLTRTAVLGLADTPRKTQGPSGSNARWLSQCNSFLWVNTAPVFQHDARGRWPARPCCLSEEINGCLTTLAVIKDNTSLYTNIGIWLRDRSYARNCISASLHFLSQIVSMAAVFHPDPKALQRLEKQFQPSTGLRTWNFIADPTFGWPHNLEHIPSTLPFYLGFRTYKTGIVRRISSVKCFESCWWKTPCKRD